MTWLSDARAVTDAATPGEWMDDERSIEGLSRLLRFHATFDPPTVAAMLDALEAASEACVRGDERGLLDLDAALARVRETMEADDG